MKIIIAIFLFLPVGLWSQVFITDTNASSSPIDSVTVVDTPLFDFSVFNNYIYDTMYHGDTLILVARVAPPNHIIQIQEDEVIPIENEDDGKEKKILVNFFQGTMGEFYESGQNQNKVLLYYFSARWCAPCRLTEQSVFASKEVADIMRSKFIIKKIDVDSYEGIEAKGEMGINELPTFVFFKGKELLRFSGMTDEYYFRKKMTEALMAQ